MSCNNCIAPIGDKRKAKKCTTCNMYLHADCAISDDGIFCDTCYVIKTEEGEYADFTLPETIRRSYIALYQQCPHKFKMEVLEGYPMPPNIYTQLGIDLHDLFEKAQYERDYSSNDMTVDIAEIFAEYPEEWFEDEEFKQRMWVRATSSIDGFYEFIHTLPLKHFAIEEKIETHIGEGIPTMNITMDRVDLVDGELELMDWKTGRVMTGVKLSSDIQVPLYIYSVREKYKMPVRRFILKYVGEKKERIYTRSEDNPDEYHCHVGKRVYKVNVIDVVREVKSILGRIKNGDFKAVPSKTDFFTKKMCHLKDLGLCCQNIDPWNRI